tara:strand:- start:346 stop:645 length:300 start_codon:yes stop_codon:yes gene_type:complete
MGNRKVSIENIVNDDATEFVTNFSDAKELRNIGGCIVCIIDETRIGAVEAFIREHPGTYLGANQPHGELEGEETKPVYPQVPAGAIASPPEPESPSSLE